jgi:N utilization substance protein B
MPLSRRQARRQALFLLYQWDLSGQPIGSQYAGEIDPWARGVAEAVASHAAELDARITAASEGWTADRLGTVERSALRVAVEELRSKDVPAEVAINEAVAFAKRYASEDAARLVNGILGRIQREEAA